MAETQRPSPRAFFANWKESDLPLLQKFRLSSSNMWTKVRKRQNCCGNHGQPGCCFAESSEVETPQ